MGTIEVRSYHLFHEFINHCQCPDYNAGEGETYNSPDNRHHDQTCKTAVTPAHRRHSPQQRRRYRSRTPHRLGTLPILTTTKLSRVLPTDLCVRRCCCRLDKTGFLPEGGRLEFPLKQSQHEDDEDINGMFQAPIHAHKSGGLKSTYSNSLG